MRLIERLESRCMRVGPTKREIVRTKGKNFYPHPRTRFVIALFTSRKTVLLGLSTQASTEKLNVDFCLAYGKKGCDQQIVNLKEISA